MGKLRFGVGGFVYSYIVGVEFSFFYSGMGSRRILGKRSIGGLGGVVSF